VQEEYVRVADGGLGRHSMRLALIQLVRALQADVRAVLRAGGDDLAVVVAAVAVAGADVPVGPVVACAAG